MLHDVPLFHKISVSATLSIHYWFPRIDLQTNKALKQSETGNAEWDMQVGQFLIELDQII